MKTEKGNYTIAMPTFTLPKMSKKNSIPNYAMIKVPILPQPPNVY
jgi:hypothetical protein